MTPVEPASMTAVHGPSPRPQGGNRTTRESSSRCTGSTFLLIDGVLSRASRGAVRLSAASASMTGVMMVLASALAGAHGDWLPEAILSLRARAQHAWLHGWGAAHTTGS
jgi:hypothetical protein